MVGYLLSVLAFISYGWWVIGAYFNQYGHGDKTPWIGFFGTTLAVWAAWSGWKALAAKDGNVRVPRWIAPCALAVQVFGASAWFAAKMMGGQGTSALFSKIFGFVFLPALFAFVSQGFGRRLVSWAAPKFSAEGDRRLVFLASLASGFSAFSLAWASLGAFGLLSKWSFLAVLALMAAASFREIAASFRWWGGSDEVRAWSPRQLSGEWFFAVLGALFASNVVSIVRSMPIGWDDLGAYMNFPKLMAQSGELLHGTGPHAWQAFTSVGFLFGSPTQAFFLSCLGGVLGVAAVWAVVAHAEGKKSMLHLPSMAAAVLYAMPMVTFQQAKDMKVDMGLLAVTAGAAYPLLCALVSKIREGAWRAPSALAASDAAPADVPGAGWKLFALLGFGIGTAFAIKVTTLITVLAAFAAFAAAAGGWAAFSGWCLSVGGAFAVAGLWNMMNVPLPAGPETARFGFGLLLAGLALLAVSAVRRRANWRNGGLSGTAALAGGFALALLPWFAMNAHDVVSAGKPLNASSLLSGLNVRAAVSGAEAVYSPAEVAERKALENQASVTSSGQTQNEDFGRYFGYGLGINNYVRLPWNMSMQANQRGEFTDITYLYLLLLPGALLFLRYRNRWLLAVPLAGVALAYVVYQPSSPAYFRPTEAESSALSGAVAFLQRDQSVFSAAPTGPTAFDVIPAGASDAQARAVLMQVADMLKAGSDVRPSGWSDAQWSAYGKVLTSYSSVAFRDSTTTASILSSTGMSEGDRRSVAGIFAAHRTRSQAVSEWFASWELPLGYLPLALLALAAVLFLTLAPEPLAVSQAFRLHAFFAVPYVLLYGVSAFAVPWYGIMMYLSFLAMAAHGLSAMAAEPGKADGATGLTYRSVGSLALFAMVSAYFVAAALPHAADNLANAGFPSFKAGLSDEASDVLLGRAGYAQILSELNLKDPDSAWRAEFSALTGSAAKSSVANWLSKLGAGAEAPLSEGVMEVGNIRISVRGKADLAAAHPVVDGMFRRLAEKILYPAAADRNDGKIYRIGTFLTYFISGNRERFFDDSLVSWFDRWVADGNPDVAAERLKKMGFKYFLVDLNAATIDRDPRHDLTRRFEGLLWALSSRKLSLVWTDNACLRAARLTDGLSKSDFVGFAGTNFESYPSSGGILSREAKRQSCAAYLEGLAASAPAGSAYPAAFAAAVPDLKPGASKEEIAAAVEDATSGQSWMAFFRLD